MIALSRSSSDKAPRVAIVGGGLVGLWSAIELRRKGAGVDVYDAGHVAGRASWAGGGILCPLWPWDYSDRITTLSLRGAQLWRDELSDAGCEGQAGLLKSGMRVLDQHAPAEQWGHRSGMDVRAQADGSVLLPDVWQVRTPRAARAVADIAVSKGVHIYPEHAAQVELRGDHATLQISEGRLPEYDHVVVCAGAWAAAVLGDLADIIDVEPVRGQMIAFAAPPGEFHEITLGGGAYVIPRSDGLVLCGSTMEYVGFDSSTTEAGRVALQQLAVRIQPTLTNYPVVEHWAGLRPGSSTGEPRIGQLSDNLWINAGHHRNGVAMAPAAAAELAQAMSGVLTS